MGFFTDPSLVNWAVFHEGFVNGYDLPIDYDDAPLSNLPDVAVLFFSFFTQQLHLVNSLEMRHDLVGEEFEGIKIVADEFKDEMFDASSHEFL